MDNSFVRQIEQIQRVLEDSAFMQSIRQVQDVARQLESAGIWRAMKENERRWQEMLTSYRAISMPTDVQEVLGRAADQRAQILASVNQTWLADLQKALRSIDHAVVAFNSDIATRAAQSLVPTLEAARRLYEGLPDLSQLRRLYEDAQRGGQTLEDSGLGFVDELWSLAFVASFAHVPAQVRHPVVTNRLVNVTRGADFGAQIESRFRRSRVLKRRWPIVRTALGAHRRREYAVSVPALISQIEGIVADVAIFKNEAIRQGSRLYHKTPSGVGAEIRGLGQLMQRSSWRTHPVLKDLAGHVADKLAPDRNGILHGARTDFGTAKQSVRCLLVVWGLSALVLELETGQSL